MAEIIGRQIELGVGVEENRGIPQSTPERWLKKITANVIEKAEKKVDESTRGVLEDSLGSRVVKKWIEGDLEGNVHADAVGYFLYNLYGAVTSSALGGGVYQHVFSVDQSIQHPSLSLIARDGSVQQFSFDNCMISTFELSATVDDFVKFTASFMGADAVSNSATPSYSDEYDFIGKDITVKIADTEAGLASAVGTKIKELSVSWDVGLINDFVLGQLSPSDLYNAKMQIEGELSLNFTDTTFKDLFLSDTSKYMEISILGDADIGGDNPELKIVFNNVQVMDWSRDDSTDEIVQQTVSFKAFYNESDGKQSEVTLVNNTAEYDQPISA